MGLHFYLLSQISTTTDEHLTRIRDAAAIRSADLCKAHSLPTPTITVVSSLSEIPQDAYSVGVVFAKDIGDPSAAAFHTINARGIPSALVAANPVQASVGDIENGALHEIFETIGDPSCADYRVRTMPDGSIILVSFELCDRCQGDSKGLDLGRGDPVNCPNVLYPNAFVDNPVPGQLFDFLGLMTSAWETRMNSYSVNIVNGAVQTVGTGNLADRKIPAEKFAGHTRLGRRILNAHKTIHYGKG